MSLYTRHAEAVAITDQMVKNQLDSYLVDIRDAEAIFEKRMAAADYQAAYNASTYAYQLWEYYINDAYRFSNDSKERAEKDSRHGSACNSRVKW